MIKTLKTGLYLLLGIGIVAIGVSFFEVESPKMARSTPTLSAFSKLPLANLQSKVPTEGMRSIEFKSVARLAKREEIRGDFESALSNEGFSPSEFAGFEKGIVKSVMSREGEVVENSLTWKSAGGFCRVRLQYDGRWILRDSSSQCKAP